MGFVDSDHIQQASDQLMSNASTGEVSSLGPYEVVGSIEQTTKLHQALYWLTLQRQVYQKMTLSAYELQSPMLTWHVEHMRLGIESTLQKMMDMVSARLEALERRQPSSITLREASITFPSHPHVEGSSIVRE